MKVTLTREGADPVEVWPRPETEVEGERPLLARLPDLVGLSGTLDAVEALVDRVDVPSGEELAELAAMLSEQSAVTELFGGRATEAWLEARDAVGQVLFRNPVLRWNQVVFPWNDVKVDQWRLAQKWYERQPWRFRDGPVPRRAPLRNVIVAFPEYPLYPRGMLRTLFGSYLIFLEAFKPIAESCGPSLRTGGLGSTDGPNEGAALVALAQARFPPCRASTEALSAATREAWVCDRILNGMHQGPLVVAGDGSVSAVIDWPEITGPGIGRNGPDHRLVLPARVEVTLASVDGRAEQVAGVTLRYPGLPAVTYTRDDARWPHALHVVRCALMLEGELDPHLARCHVLAELVQVALHVVAEDLGSDHALFRLLAPHVDGADVIDRVGDWLILGEEGVISVSTPFDGERMGARLARACAAHRWRGFAPRAAVATNDGFAAAAGVFWPALHAWVAAELRDVAPDDWSRRLGDVLARHGVAFERPETAGDWVQLCAFVVFHATFLHTWVNDTQWTEGGDASVTSLGLRLAAHEGPDRYDDWRALAQPAAIDRGYQQAIVFALDSFDVGSVDRNDAWPPISESFRAMVRSLGPPFAAGHPDDRRLDLHWLRSRLNA